jgi:siderophore synthetase component
MSKLADKLSDALTESIKADLQRAIQEVITQQLYADTICAAVEEFVTEQLTGARCWIDFNDSKVRAFIGIGHGDIAFKARVEISIDDYVEVEQPYPAQMEDMREQLVGLETFINDLMKAKEQLQAALDRKEQQLAELA